MRRNVVYMADYDEGAFLRLMQTEEAARRRTEKRRRERRRRWIENFILICMLCLACFSLGMVVSVLC